MKKINFNVELKDAFGQVVREKHRAADTNTNTDTETYPVMLDISVVNILGHPASVPEGTTLTPMEVLERLNLQQKVASKAEQEYSPEELARVREATITLFNKKMLGLDLAGTIIKMTE